MRFRAENTRDSAQGYIQCRKCIGRPVVRTDGRTDVRTDGRTYGCRDGRSRDYYVTTKIFWLDRLPNFLSNGAPLARWLRYKLHESPPLALIERECLKAGIQRGPASTSIH